MGKRIIYGKKADGKQNSWTAIPDWVTRKNYLTPPQQVVYELILVNSIGFGKKQYHKKVFITELAKQKGMNPKATSRALKDLKRFGLIDFKKEKNGAKIMIKVKDLLPTFWEGDKDISKVEKDISKVEKVSTPPRSKELPKELFKELSKEAFTIKEFIGNWILEKEGKESLNKKFSIRFDKYNLEEAFNSLSTTNQKKAVLSIPKYKEHLCINPDKIKYVPKASNYIYTEIYLEQYKPVQTEIDNQKRIKEQKEYDRHLDENACSLEERIEILESIKKKLGGKNDR